MSKEYLKIKEDLNLITNKTCNNCYFKETAGSMVDPCFPCTMEDDDYPKYYWLPDTWSKEQVNEYGELQDEHICKILHEDPAYQKLLNDMVDHMLRKKNKKQK